MFLVAYVFGVCIGWVMRADGDREPHWLDDCVVAVALGIIFGTLAAQLL